jgi:hypothetical protein
MCIRIMSWHNTTAPPCPKYLTMSRVFDHKWEVGQPVLSPLRSHMYSVYSPPRLLPMLLASIFFLAACSNKSAAPTTTAVPSAASSEAARNTAISPAGTTVLNEALNPKEVKFILTLVGQPRYIADKDVLQFNIQINNQGQTTLVGAGTRPVNLAALLLGPNGPDKAPGLREFVRVHLPPIAPGERKTLEADLPGDSLKGQTVEFNLVQEGVAWFSGAGQAGLTLGAYSRCSDASKTLCDAAGTSVAK